jgi:hypothetical protein
MNWRCGSSGMEKLLAILKRSYKATNLENLHKKVSFKPNYLAKG